MVSKKSQAALIRDVRAALIAGGRPPSRRRRGFQLSGFRITPSSSNEQCIVEYVSPELPPYEVLLASKAPWDKGMLQGRRDSHHRVIARYQEVLNASGFETKVSDMGGADLARVFVWRVEKGEED